MNLKLGVLGVVVHSFDLSTQETGVWAFQLQASQGYVVRLKQKKRKF